MFSQKDICVFEYTDHFYGRVQGATIRSQNLRGKWPYRRSSRAFSSIFRKCGLKGFTRAPQSRGDVKYPSDWSYKRHLRAVSPTLTNFKKSLTEISTE